MKYIYKILIVIFLLTSFSACDLDVENVNNPDTEKVLSTPEGVKNLTAGLFNKWFQAEQHNFGSPGPAMWVMADWGTVTFANYGTVDASAEPRIFLNNRAEHNHHSMIRNFWRNMYAVVTTSNDILQAIDRGVDLGEDEMMVKGMSYFMQGLGNGYVGLVYDKGYPSDETIEDYATLTIQPYDVSIDMAISELERAIEVFDNNSFTLPEAWMTRPFTNQDMSKIAHSYIARLMVYRARNTTQAATTDWQVVLNHAVAGIDEDFTIEGDGNISGRKWMSWYKYYMSRPSWGKVDMRVIHMIDPNLPANWPDGGLAVLPFNGIMDSPDFRVSTDFQHNTNNNRPERGEYRWSTYRYKRFDDYINANFFAPVMLMRKAEIDLLKAEAYLHLDQLTDATTIINNGTRINRGGLPAINEDETEIANAIIYERTVELPLTGMGIEYFDMRRRGELQDGSLLHFPIPAQQLEILGEPIYTFGGVQPQYGVQNEDVSINGWYAAPIN